mgnify:CR=1 FL=1
MLYLGRIMNNACKNGTHTSGFVWSILVLFQRRYQACGFLTHPYPLSCARLSSRHYHWHQPSEMHNVWMWIRNQFGSIQPWLSAPKSQNLHFIDLVCYWFVWSGYIRLEGKKVKSWERYVNQGFFFSWKLKTTETFLLPERKLGRRHLWGVINA